MKALASLLLVGAVHAQDVQMTPSMVESIQNFVGSSFAVCKKRNIGEKECGESIDKTAGIIRKRVDELCTDYPKEKTPCIQYGLEYLMNHVTKNNIFILNSKEV